ncbi:MAG: PAS domain S-box protein [Deltaproteobacteria bacterium]
MSDLRPTGSGEKPTSLAREDLLAALESREQFLTAVLGSLESFVTVDEEWRLTFANQAAATMAGVARGDLLGRTIWEVVPFVADGESRDALLRAMAERARVEYDMTNHDTGATYRGSAHPVSDGGLAVYLRDVTERVASERALRASRERYRELVEHVNSVIVRWTRDGKLTFLNAYAEQLFGWSADEALGRHVSFLLPEPDEAEQDLSHLVEDIVAHPERYASNVNENVRKDGSRLWMSWTNRALLDERGQVEEILGIGNDITELMRAQNALRESEERYRIMIETAGEGITFMRPDGTYFFVNQRMADMLGYSVEDIVGRSAADFTFDDGQAATLDMLAQLPNGQVSGESRFRRRDGSELWSNYSATPVFDAADRHVANFGMYTDITERRHAEDALRESEERFRTLADNAPLLIWVMDADGGLRFINRAYREFFGVTEEQVRGRGWHILLHPDDQERYVDGVLTATRERRPFRGEARVRNASGEWRWIDSHGMPRFSDSGTFLGMVGSSPDITDRKRAEEALRDSQRRLQIATAAADLGIYDWDLRTGMGEWDARVRAIFGVGPEEPLTLETFLARLHPDDRARAQAEVEAALDPSGDGHYHSTYRVLGAKDESVRWVQSTGWAVVDQGSVVRLVGSAQDITARVQAEQALRTGEALQAAAAERTRLARDLHDSVTQALFAASLKAEALSSSPGMVSPAGMSTAEEVSRLSRGALAQMRTMLLELRGDPIEDVPIEELLRNVVDAAQSRTSTEITLKVRGGAQLPNETHVAVYRIAQEALNNVARHAKATSARVELDADVGRVRLTVEDDGRGFDPTMVGPTNLGLKSMRERAREADARFSLVTEPDRGTLVVVEWGQESRAEA